MIKTFESETGQIQSCDLVQLCVQGMTSETYLYVNAYAVPIICSPPQNQAVNFAASTYQHLSGLLLADSISADENENNLEVDVLIGADYYWHFLTGAIKRGESEPLTPSHLVIGRRLLTLPVGPLQIDDWDFGDHLTSTKRSCYLADRIQHFRRRW
ncbi:unnamed protein product [Porites evermanni]|uniref:Peptidase aspartic putative domain-containing protein n=1 Tax=Porites evermanni TaxID=104178 RepID=A0ABN8MMX5_9CNID|nr:unnamed protein product [Porites evermanni]